MHQSPLLPLPSFLLPPSLLLLLLVSAPATAQVMPLPNEVEQETAPDPETTLQDILAGEGWLGVGLGLTSLEEAEALGYAKTLIRIDTVFPDTPAASSGFMEGDLLLAFEDERLYDTTALIKKVKATKPGTKSKVLLYRDGKEIEATVLLGTRPESLEFLSTYYLDKPAPTLNALHHPDDSPASLEEYKGKVIIIDFWASWCGPCRVAMPHLDELYMTYKDHGLVILGVSDDEKENIAGTLAETPVNYPILRDDKGETNREYMITALPTLYVVDRKGIVREIVIGASGLDALEDTIKVLLVEKVEE